MSAKDQIAQMLDELMGTTRNGGESTSSYKFDDRNVCRAFLLGCCPYMLLAQTKADMGNCNKIHDLALKADYEKALLKRNDYNFEYDALSTLEKFLNESDRRKEIAKARLKENQEELSKEAAKEMSKMAEIDDEISAKLVKVEEYGSEGDADNSLKILEEIEELKKKKSDLQHSFTTANPVLYAEQQQKLRVCDICSALLGIHDNDRRLVDHFGGKLHLGFITIREKTEELKKKVQELREKRLAARDSKRRSRSTSRSGRNSSPPSSRKRSSKSARSRSRESRTRRSRSRSREYHSRDSRHSNRHSKEASRYDKRRRSRSRS